MADDMLYFDERSFPYIQTEMLFQILAHQRADIIMKLNPEEYTTKEAIANLIESERSKIIEKFYADHGYTPGVPGDVEVIKNSPTE